MSAINANNQNSNPSANESPFSVENFIYARPLDLLFLYKDAYRNADSTTESSLDRSSNKFTASEKSYMELTEELTCNYRFQKTGSNTPETITCSTENLKDCTANPPSNQQAILDSFKKRLSTLPNNLSTLDVRRSLYKLDPVEVECQSIFKTYTNSYIKPDLVNFFIPKLNEEVHKEFSSTRNFLKTACKFKDDESGPSIDCESLYTSKNDRTAYEGKFFRSFHNGKHEFKIDTVVCYPGGYKEAFHDLWKTALNNCERAKIESYDSNIERRYKPLLKITYEVPVQEEIASHTNFNSIIPVVLGCITLIGIFYSAYKYCCSSARSDEKSEPKAE